MVKILFLLDYNQLLKLLTTLLETEYFGKVRMVLLYP